MTVIAWDGVTLAADKRAGTEMPRTVTKIYRAKNGHLIGCTGNAHGDAELRAWYEDGAKPEKFPAVHRVNETSSLMIEITLDRKILTYLNGPYPAIFENEFHAIGSGRDFAMAGMHMGLSAKLSVELACALSATCGDGIDVLKLETSPLVDHQ